MMTLPDLSFLVWMIPLTLAGLALFQLLFWIVATVTMRPDKLVRQPNAPIMPTNPAPRPKNTPPAITGASMVVTSGIPSPGELPMPSGSFIIGRYYHPENNVMIALDERSISRRHAQFTGDDSAHTYFLTDLNSSYGTAFKRGEKLEPLTANTRVRVYNGDIVQFGVGVTARMVLPGESRADITQA
jgi:hypothetical protein